MLAMSGIVCSTLASSKSSVVFQATRALSRNFASGCPFAQIVKATAPAVAGKVRDIVDDFYLRRFKNNPETLAFFNPANQFADPPNQRLALANAIVAYATNIDHPEKLSDAVEIIAHKHCGLNVQQDHYSIVHKNLMESIGHTLGAAVTPEVGEGWSEAVLALAKGLIETEKQLYHMAEHREGGWKGVKQFRVSSMRQVAQDCLEFTFKPLDGTSKIDFTPGQFLTLHLDKQGATPRHYTITNNPGRDFLQCCVKKIPGGFVSNALHALNEGDTVGLSPPFGTFKMSNRPAVLISAGIGATPMKAFLDSSAKDVELVVHVDKHADTHPFKTEMLASGAKTHFIYTRSESRPTAEDLVKDVLHKYIDHDFYLCGPPGFLGDAKLALQGAGAKHVNLDIFGPTLSAA